MATKTLPCMVLILAVAALTEAWVPAFHGAELNGRWKAPTMQRQRTSTRVPRLCASSRDDEIARLEAEIRKLRDAASSDDLDGEDTAESAFAAAQALADKKRLLAQVRGKDMLLTEGTLIQENILENEGSTVGIAPAILGAVLAAAVIAFSQIPVGQEDLSRYSVQAGPTVSTKIDLGDINPDRPTP
jgi:hypothetical protein